VLRGRHAEAEQQLARPRLGSVAAVLGVLGLQLRRAQEILEKWAVYRPRFVKIFPKEYRRALGELAAQKKAAA